MDLYKLYSLLKNEEGFKLDFKLKLNLETESEKKEFVKDVIAIANTPGGRGYIIFGIEDHTRKIVGIEEPSLFIEEKIQQIIANRSTPPVPVRFDKIEVEKKKVGVLTIFKSMQIPHQMLQTGAFYIRRGSTTDKANRHEIANMLQQYGMLSFENVPCRNSRLENLDEEAVKQYCKGLVIDKHQYILLLSTMGILSSDLEKEVYYPTYGGLLLFGKRPQDFIPQAVLEVQTENEIIGIEGNIMNMIHTFNKLMLRLLPASYPREAVLEVVTNAIIHRNYWNNSEYIQVLIHKNQVVVTNPMSLEKYESKNYKKRLNPWLYSRLLLMQKQNNFHLGIGLEKAKDLFRDKGEVKIISNCLEGIFEVILPGIDQYKEDLYGTK